MMTTGCGRVGNLMMVDENIEPHPEEIESEPESCLTEIDWDDENEESVGSAP